MNYSILKKTSYLGLVLTLTFGAQSCGKKGCTDPAANNYDAEAKKDDGLCTYDESTGGLTITTTTYNGESYEKIEGSLTGNYTLTAGTKWMLSGGVFVEDGATLTIEAGTMVYADADPLQTPFLSILQGGMIMANGTASDPIVFTPADANPTSGSWGGIIVNGYASINTGETAQGEGDTGTYGGSNDADNSGTLRYVVVAYAGKILGTDNELNGFSFNGVGSETTLEYLQAYMGSDDGFEFFGGTADLKYAISTGNSDDSFDWTHGWRGNGQFWVVNQSPLSGDRGIEADNNGDNNILTPYSNPTLSNLTLVGADDANDDSNTGMRLREGTKGMIYNAIVTNFPNKGIRVSDSETITNMEAGELMVSNSAVFANGTNFDAADIEANATNSTDAVGLSGYVGTSSTNATEASTLGSWFTSANFVGAVESSNDWTAGWSLAL